MRFEDRILPLEECLDALIDYRGKSPEKTDSGIPLVTAKIVKDGVIETPTEFIAQENYQAWMRRGLPEAGDVVLTTEAPLGEVAQLTSARVALAQRIILLRGKKGVLNNRFLKYVFMTREGRRSLEERATGTTVLGIKQSELRKVLIPVPDIGTQTEIASMLGSLDDRVAVLRETNSTLEAIAAAIFKSWFVDFDPVRAKAEGREPEGMDAETAALFPDGFEESESGEIPRGWTAGTIGDVAQNPRAQVKPEQLTADSLYIGLEHMPRRSLSLFDAGTAAGLESGKFQFQRDDVLFGKLRPYFHKVGLAPCAGVCSTDILVIRPKAPMYLGFVALHAFSDALVGYTTKLSNGARMPRTSWQDVASYKVTLPPSELAQAFEDLMRPIFDKLYFNIETSKQLAALRDTLLPRLMSGKLRLAEFPGRMEEVILE